MQTNLTLQIDEALVQKADRWARAHNMTLSEAIVTLLKQLPDLDQPLALSAWTQSLVGGLVRE